MAIASGEYERCESSHQRWHNQCLWNDYHTRIGVSDRVYGREKRTQRFSQIGSHQYEQWSYIYCSCICLNNIVGGVGIFITVSFSDCHSTGASWFHSDELEIDRTATMVPRRDPIKVTKVFQVIKTECSSINEKNDCKRFFFFIFRLIKTQYLFAMVRL